MREEPKKKGRGDQLHALVFYWLERLCG